MHVTVSDDQIEGKETSRRALRIGHRDTLTPYYVSHHFMMSFGGDTEGRTSGVKRVGGLAAIDSPISHQLITITMLSLDVSHSTAPFCLPPVTTSTIVCRPTFPVLPEEIVVKILEWCDFKGVLACQRVCATTLQMTIPTTLLPSSLAVTHRRAAPSEMSSWVRQAYGINSLSPNTECATARRAI
jgi:hypothetical protein